MDTDEDLGVRSCQGLADDGPVVATSRDKFFVSEFLGHQLGEQVSIVVNRLGNAIRESRTRQRRHNHVERIVRIAAIFRRIGEPIDHLVVAIERVGKAVEQQERCRVWSFAAFVDEMDAYAIHVRFELRKGIKRYLVCAPVIALLPVVH